MTRTLAAIFLLCQLTCTAGEVNRGSDQIELKDDQIKFLRVSPKKYEAEGADFFMQETEVTNRMFAAYLKARKLEKSDQALHKADEEKRAKRRATGTFEFTTRDAALHIKNPALLWNSAEPPAGAEDFPVAMVTVKEAAEFCEWLTARYPELGTFRLPKETEWLLAAYGKNRKFPWGNDWDKAKVCMDAEPNAESTRDHDTKASVEELKADIEALRKEIARTKTVAAARSPESVKARSNGRTPEGLFGMLGNVSEFIIHPSEKQDAFFIDVGGRWMGGSFEDDRFKPRQDYWGYWHNSDGRSQDIGFRVLLDVEDKEHKFKHQVPYDFSDDGEPPPKKK